MASSLVSGTYHISEENTNRTENAKKRKILHIWNGVACSLASGTNHISEENTNRNKKDK